MNYISEQYITKLALTIPLHSKFGFSADIKKAFTLAEVLITLVIIGVVAALSIPTLLSKYNDHVTSTQVKKANSMLQQAVKLMFTQNGCSAGDMDCLGYYDNTNLTFDGKTFDDLYTKQIYMLSKQFKIAKFCENTTECAAKKYIVYKVGNRAGYMTNTKVSGFVTQDGMCIFKEVSADPENTIMVDVDCEKGKNAFSRDLFAFETAKETKENIPTGSVFMYGTMPFAKYEGNINTYWRNIPGCPNITNNNTGYYCGARFLEM